MQFVESGNQGDHTIGEFDLDVYVSSNGPKKLTQRKCSYVKPNEQ